MYTPLKNAQGVVIWNQGDLARIVYRFGVGNEDFRKPNVTRVCDHCGNYLHVLDCGDHIYMVWCKHCSVMALTTAKNRDEAACKTLGS